MYQEAGQIALEEACCLFEILGWSVYFGNPSICFGDRRSIHHAGSHVIFVDPQLPVGGYGINGAHEAACATGHPIAIGFWRDQQVDVRAAHQPLDVEMTVDAAGQIECVAKEKMGELSPTGFFLDQPCNVHHPLGGGFAGVAREIDPIFSGLEVLCTIPHDFIEYVDGTLTTGRSAGVWQMAVGYRFECMAQ